MNPTILPPSRLLAPCLPPRSRFRGFTRVLAGCAAALLFGATVAHAEDTAAPAMPEMPKPVKEHAWLQKFAGEWTTETEAYMEPGKPPMKAKGTEKVRSLGGFWIVSEIDGEMMGSKYQGLLTLGYDPEKKKYIGTWVDSVTSLLWSYTGSVNEAGTTLTLEAEGPCPMRPGQLTKFRDVVELKDDNTKTMTSSVQGEDGQWTVVMKMVATRKK